MEEKLNKSRRKDKQIASRKEEEKKVTNCPQYQGQI